MSRDSAVLAAPAPAAPQHDCLLRDLGTLNLETLTARDAAWLDAHAAGLIGDQLYFCRSGPAISLGCHLAAEREARQPYCDENGIAITRRLSAGGALYLDSGQQLVCLIVPSSRLGTSVASRLRRGAELVADALASLGIATSFKAPNDLQTESRQKIASVFLAERGPSTLLTASIISVLDIKAAMQALLVPTEKLTVTGLEHARERMTSLADELGAAPAPAVLHRTVADACAAGLSLRFHATAELEDTVEPEPPVRPAPWTLSASSIETKDKVEGATFRLLMDVTDDDVASAIRIATDAHFSPATALAGLARALNGSPLEKLPGLARDWLKAHMPDAAGFTAVDLVKLIGRAASKRVMQRQFGLSPEQATGLMLAGAGDDPAASLGKASVMLVPYCAKPSWCKWRHTIDCVECGECEVGDAYEMARQRNMEVVTITNFEHLSDTLGKMKDAGVESYVGMCCGEFFLKRHHAFRDSGMDAVLLDIEGATCYELKEEQLAYAGAFKAEAKLDLDAVRKVMARVPARPLDQKPCLTEGPRPAEKFKAAKDAKGCGSGTCGCGRAGVTE